MSFWPVGAVAGAFGICEERTLLLAFAKGKDDSATTYCVEMFAVP